MLSLFPTLASQTLVSNLWFISVQLDLLNLQQTSLAKKYVSKYFTKHSQLFTLKCHLLYMGGNRIQLCEF